MLPKAVIDTNIWVSYFISAKTDSLFKLILDKELKIFTSEELISEIREVLSRPKFKKQFPFPSNDFMKLHIDSCQLVKSKKRFFSLAPDPDDNFLFDLCIQSDSDYLVTGDKRLLHFEHGLKLKVITISGLNQILNLTTP